MNTIITIDNEHGSYSVSAPIDPSFDDLLDLFVMAAQVASWSPKTIDQGIIEKAEEIEDLKRNKGNYSFAGDKP